MVSGPQANCAIGGGAVEELTGEDEGGDVGGVGFEGGDGVVLVAGFRGVLLLFLLLMELKRRD